MASTFRNAIDFFVQIGLYDVVLPFLLVFTLMFAFLEKTKVLGTEPIRSSSGDIVQVTRRNLNAMIGFVTGLFVVLSAQLVSIINEVLGNVVLLILLSFLMLLVMGTFMKPSETGIFFGPGKDQNPFLYYSLMAIGFVTIILIFLNAIKTADGRSWLSIIMDSAMNAAGNEFWSVLILLILIIGGVAFVTRNNEPGKDD